MPLKGTDYAYAVARIRALEARMPGRSDLDRLFDVRTREDAYRILSEWGYVYSDSGGNDSNEGNGNNDSDDIEHILSRAARQTVDFLKELSPEKNLLDPFTAQNDFHNLKVIIKSELISEDVRKKLLKPGNIDAAALGEYIRERKKEKLPPELAEALSEIIDMLAESQSIKEIGIIADRHCFRQMGRLAAETGYAFIIDLVELLADLSNIKTFLRLKSSGAGPDILKKVLLDKGRLKQSFFIEHLGDSRENFASALYLAGYGGVLGEEAGSSDTSLMCDKKLLEFVKKADMTVLGPESLVAYYFKKEFEIMNIRIILTGRLNNLPVDIIRERLRVV